MAYDTAAATTMTGALTMSIPPISATIGPTGENMLGEGGGLTLTGCNEGEKEGGGGEVKRRQQRCGGSGGDVVMKRGRFTSRWTASSTSAEMPEIRKQEKIMCVNFLLAFC
jgi:hypothetical protein